MKAGDGFSKLEDILKAKGGLLKAWEVESWQEVKVGKGFWEVFSAGDSLCCLNCASVQNHRI